VGAGLKKPHTSLAGAAPAEEERMNSMDEQTNAALVLYYFPLSTTSQKVRLVAHHKGIRLDERVVDLLELEQLEPSYRALNASAQVPTLLVDGRPVVESSIINELLEERFPAPPLLPRDAVTRALIRGWTKYVDAGPTVDIAVPTFRAWVSPALAARPSCEVLGAIASVPDATTRRRWERAARQEISDQDVAAAYASIGGMLDRMEGLLAGDPWLFGGAPSLADLETVPLVVRLQHLGRAELVGARPRVAGWFERVQALGCFAPVYAPIYAAMRA
jgi:glutathione S-transferase